MSDPVRPHRWQPTRLPRPWDSPGKNTGVGCYFLLQCMKVKRESEVAQSCPTLCDPIDYSLPGCSVHGIFQARVLAALKCVWEPVIPPPPAAAAASLQTLCSAWTRACQAPLSTGFPQARTLEWVAISSSSDSGIKPMSPEAPALQADSLPLSRRGRPLQHSPSKPNNLLIHSHTQNF